MNFLNYHTLTINGVHLEGKEIIEYCRKNNQQNTKLIGDFISEWMREQEEIEIRTSGSTGTPKIISVKKDQMLSSAAMTAKYFDFKAGQTALLCLPVNYIAGKMMVVRALFSKLNLVCIEPGNAPLSLIPDKLVIDFAPMIPMQLNGVQQTPNIHKILLGGGPIHPGLEKHLQYFKSEIYHGYGMTETLSHVAIRRINGSGRSEIYRALRDITFGTDERNCLNIHASFLRETVQTNDIVELLNRKEFIWKGRYDNVVNSGGIKLFPEEIENKLFPLIAERFFVAGLPDKKLGEKLCLFIEGESFSNEKLHSLQNSFFSILDKYEKPKEIVFIKKFTNTASGKIMREETVGNK